MAACPATTPDRNPPPECEWTRRHHAARWIIAVILVSSFILKLPNLGHRHVKPLDEVFHAIVAANLLKHPLTPTLNDRQYIDFDHSLWQNTHVWLHKPPMAMWQIAISYALLGVNTLALRLPSAILATLAVWLTYLIGKELLDQIAGIIAAALQAFNPVIAMLVHGHVFSDHVDVSLLFWVELAIWLLVRGLRTGNTGDFALCGLAQGFAFLSKTYPALIVTVLALAALGLSRKRLRMRFVLIMLLGTTAVVLPWTLWCLVNWRELFIHENLHALRHLGENIEGWAAPWDRLLFDFWIRIFHVNYPATLAALVLAVAHAWRRRDTRLCLVIVWACGVLLPHLLATSKTMTATLIGWPAMWLLVGWMISQAVRGDSVALGTWLASMLLPFTLRGGDIPSSGWGVPDTPGFAAIMRQHLWVVWHAAIGIGCGLLMIKLRSATLRHTLCAIAAAAMLVLALRPIPRDQRQGYMVLSWRVTRFEPENARDFDSIGTFARKLPSDAVFMVDEKSKLENKLIQFVADRTCYPLPDARWQEMGQAIIARGGIPYVVTDRELPLPVVFVDEREGRKVYACTPKARAAAERSHDVLTP
jgi:4-amino-4-deoxy-L-arabinose transferase